MNLYEKLQEGGDQQTFDFPKEKGDTVMGKIVAIGGGQGEHGAFDTLDIDVFTDGTTECSGEVKTVPMWGILAGFFQKNAHRMKPGATVGILCEGMKENASGSRSYRDFSTVLEDGPTIEQKLGDGGDDDLPF